MIKIKLLLVSLSLATVGCGVAETNFSLVNSSEPEDNWSDPNPALSNEVNALIQSKLLQINPCTKKNENSDPNCIPVEVKTSNNNSFANNNSLGYRILLVDNGMQVAALTRYKDRVLKNLVEDKKTGDYIDKEISFKIPLAAKEVLEKTFENPTYNNIPSELLKPSSNIFNEKFLHMIEYINTSLDFTGPPHGLTIFNYLANNIPNSQFVLVYATENKLTEILCDNEMSEDKKLEHLKLIFQNQASRLINEIKENNISFLSFSKGYSNKQLKKIVKDEGSKCSYVSDNLMTKINKAYFHSYLKSLTTKTDVILVQSNLEADYYVDPKKDSNYYSDCQELKNRIRVGAANNLTNSIPPLGSHNISILDNFTKNSELCTEMYINFAVQKKRPFFYNKGVIQLSSFNIGTEAATGFEISSSNATPVALSYLIYLKMQLEKANPGKEISNEMLIKRLQENNNFIFDPSLHKQLPIYELGYLK
ncbi:hypothetical protein [Fluviispira vulneris]|uniref:hypothetical protein n=1 Tax=Fluviispira vulneris TaxID=2763012 RepID=UPI001644F25C|nr:hypothetical protein [Fluviispira vulneris]